jgi:hypothetical protein
MHSASSFDLEAIPRAANGLVVSRRAMGFDKNSTKPMIEPRKEESVVDCALGGSSTPCVGCDMIPIDNSRREHDTGISLSLTILGAASNLHNIMISYRVRLSLGTAIIIRLFSEAESCSRLRHCYLGKHLSPRIPVLPLLAFALRHLDRRSLDQCLIIRPRYSGRQVH